MILLRIYRQWIYAQNKIGHGTDETVSVIEKTKRYLNLQGVFWTCLSFQGGSQQGLDSVGRGNTGAAVGIGSLKREPSYPDFSRYRNIGPPSDGASDTASTSSLFPGEYTGPKLFVKPSAKSNRSIILNALNVVLAGAVNADTKKRATNVSKKI